MTRKVVKSIDSCDETICNLFRKPLNMQFLMVSYKEAIHICNVCKTVLKKPFKCELCEQKFEQKFEQNTLICTILKKSTKCILCDQKFKKSRLYVRFVGKDLKNMYQVAQKFSLNVTGTMWD